MTNEQIKANSDCKYHLDRLIAFAQCKNLSATQKDIYEAIKAIFNDDVSQVSIHLTDLWVEPDYTIPQRCTIRKEPCFFGGKRTRIEF